MKRLNLAVLLASLALLVSGHVVAEEVSKKGYSNHQFSGQRPYMKAPDQDSTSNTEGQWEGATLVTDEETATNKGHSKHQQMRLNLLGKRPYMEKGPD